MTRIISGRLRGKRIIAPRNLPVRPTTDMAKESLFNILNNHFYFDELKVLDLFAGTGNISFELASRGCTDITAIDRDNGCVKFINKTAEILQMEGLTAFRADVLQFLERDYHKYDLIFADPPYEFEDYEKLIDIVFLKNLLAEDGMLVVEHQERLSLSHLEHYDHDRKYGNARFSFFKPEDEEDID